MHNHSESTDSSYAIRINPLNIRCGDGSDLVIDQEALRQTVSTAKPKLDSSPVSCEATQGEILWETARAVSVRDAVPTAASQPSNNPAGAAELKTASVPAMKDDQSEPSIPPLNVPKKRISTADLPAVDLKQTQTTETSSCKPRQSREELRHQASEVQLVAKQPPNDALNDASSSKYDMDLSDLGIMSAPQLSISPDVGTSLQEEFAGMSLSRKPTIKSKGTSVSHGPSRTRSPELVQRLRSLRKNKQEYTATNSHTVSPTFSLDDQLPADVLHMIDFSPNMNLPEESEESEDGEDSSVMGSRAGTPQSVVPGQQAASASQSNVATPDTSKETPAESYMSSRSSLSNTPSDLGEPVTSTPKLADIDPVCPDDRGRLFLQMAKVNNMRGLPLDASRNPRLSLVLDNGMQTVTTPQVPIPPASFTGMSTVNVGQEFELIVGHDLELVITVHVHMDAVQPPPKPRSKAVLQPQTTVSTPPPSPTRRTVMKFLSPKRKKTSSKPSNNIDEETLKHSDRQIAEDKEYEKTIETFRRRKNFWKNVTGPEGEFARGYVFESHYEEEIYGQVQSYQLPLYNEWTGGESRHVCDLQMTLLYVPKLYASETLPTSLRECHQQLAVALQNRQLQFEGFLTQNGGDCALWRRRWFTLRKNELVGHHEATRKARTMIHMQNATGIVDAADISGNDDMWCIYEDRSFRVTFNDGEKLCFYADTVALKEQWMNSLKLSMAHCGGHRSWTDLVIDRRCNSKSR